MKTLIVCAAPVSGLEVHVLRLAGSADLVLAADGGARLCLAAGVSPDVVVGDLDSLDGDTLSALAANGVPVLEFPADKDDTDLDLALREARRRGAAHVTVCAAFSGRLDHTLAAVGSLVGAADLRPRISEPGLDGWLIDPGHRAEVAIAPSGTTFSVIPMVEGATVSVAGARWPLDHACLDLLGSRGISNRVEGDRSVVRIHSGVALVIVAEPRDLPL